MERKKQYKFYIKINTLIQSYVINFHDNLSCTKSLHYLRLTWSTYQTWRISLKVLFIFAKELFPCLFFIIFSSLTISIKDKNIDKKLEKIRRGWHILSLFFIIFSSFTISIEDKNIDKILEKIKRGWQISRKLNTAYLFY